MPRAKATVKKTSAKSSPIKKRTKKVLVDVIADEPKEFIVEPETTTSEEAVGKFTATPITDDIDQQKNFYSSLASEMKSKKSKTGIPATDAPRKTINLYRRLALKFVIFTAILVAIVIYFSFSKLTITITPKGEIISDTILLKVAGSQIATTSATVAANNEQNDPRELVPGTVQVTEATAQKSYSATGQEETGAEISGTVKIINNYNKGQALVATTRLLSADNKLFRIKNAVNVPAGGQVSVDIYADKPTTDLAIGPSTFTIPGLWLGLQDKIYARSDTAFNYQNKITKFINPSDLQGASTDIKNQLIANTQANLSSQGGDWLYDTSEPALVTFNAKSGDKLNEFTATAHGKIIAVSFSKEQAAKLAASKLNLLVPDDKILTEFKPGEITYILQNYNPKDGSATIQASFTGTMMLKSDATIVDRQKLVDLNQAQIDNYLQSFPEIKDYDLSFFPSFIKKAPSLVDRIKIKINTVN